MSVLLALARSPQPWAVPTLATLGRITDGGGMAIK
jgi:hypothetical protein